MEPNRPGSLVTDEAARTSFPAPSSPGIALWNQRHVLLARRPRIVALLNAVDRPDEMTLLQMMGLMALVLDHRPNVILELGRLYGNSTCAFTEAANMVGADSCRVTSLCLTPNWDTATVPRLRAVVDEAWLRTIDALREDILTFDYARLFSNHRRVMVFWDAHGYGIANCVLGKMMPLLSDREHVVAMHDISDARYLANNQADYNGHSLWTHNDWSGRHVRLGWVQSNVEQAVAVVDFTSRNNVPLDSATNSMRTELSTDQLAELDEMLGLDASRAEAGWVWFSLNGTRAGWTFPRFIEPGAGTRFQTRALMASLSLAGRFHVDRPARALVRASRRVRG